MQVIEVHGRKLWKGFFSFPIPLFKTHPAWVSPILSEQEKQLDPRKNPFFSHAMGKAWMVFEGDRALGRIYAFIDLAFNNYQETEAGFFGFFDVVDNLQAANLLFETAAGWLKANGASQMLGPMNLSIGEACGVQLNGFEHPPVIQMNFSPPYYRKLFEQAGFSKSHDMLAYLMSVRDKGKLARVMARLERIKILVERRGLRIRSLDLSRFSEDLGHIGRLFNESMNSNFGYSPASAEEIAYMGKCLKPIADPELIFFAEKEGQVVGCSLALPDIHQAWKYVKNGQRFPLGWFYFLSHRKSIDRLRLFLMCVQKEYRNRGLDALFYYHTIQKGMAKGFVEAECSWISEDNHNLIRIMQKIEAEPYKTYRMYQRSL